MKNTERLANAVRSYMQEKATINAKYNDQIAALEKYKGSAGYNGDVLDINAQREAELSAARKVYAKAATDALKEMQTVLEARKTPMKAPSNEQLNAIQALKLKETVNQTEIRAAADLCRDNETAMSIIREIARNNQIYGVDLIPTDKVYENAQAVHYWDNMRRSCSDLFRAQNELPYYLRRLESLENETEIINKLSVYPAKFKDLGGGLQTAETDTEGVNALSAVLNGDK